MTVVEVKPKILAVDTSSQIGSVALCQGESLVAEVLLNSHSTHSETLLNQIDLLLDKVGWRLADLDLLAAATGPGSFTGLRIGVATIKGLAQVLEKPVVGVSTLEMLALNLPLCPVPICAFLDARKKEVYSQLFHWSGHGPIAAGAAQVLPPEQLLRGLEGQVALVGDGVPLYRALIEEILEGRAMLPTAMAHQPRAAQATWLALRAFRAGADTTAAELLPVYIRPSDAELKKSTS